MGLTDLYVASLIQKYGSNYQRSREWTDYITAKNINMRYFLSDEPPLHIYLNGDWQTIYNASGTSIQIQN